MPPTERPRGRKADKAQPKKRMSYTCDFKLMVVKEALQRPRDNRIKPTCAHFPGIEPCQVRQTLPPTLRWLRVAMRRVRRGATA